MPVKTHTLAHTHARTHMKGQQKVLALKKSKNYEEKEKTHMRSSFSKLVLVFWASSKRNMKIVIYTHTQYTNACVCVRHLNGKAAAAAVDLKFFYHICQIRIYASLLCWLKGDVFVYM